MDSQNEDEDECHHLWQIRVTKVLDPSNFYAQFSQDYLFEHFALMEAELQTYCKDEEHEEVCYLDDGMTVLAFSTILEKWLRAEVVTNDNEAQEADLVYIDYGLSEMRTWDLIIAKFDQKFLTLPRMAYMCCLAGVKPLAKRWISRAVTYFTDLLLDVVADADVIVLDGVSPLLTRIFVQQEGTDVSVADLMMAEELALPDKLPATPQARSPATVAKLSDASPKLKTNFESLFKEPPAKRSIDEAGDQPLKPWQMDPKERHLLMGELKYMFGEELVDKVLITDEKTAALEDSEKKNESDSSLTLEQQIRKMRNKKTNSKSPSKRSRDAHDVTPSTKSRDVKGKSRRPETTPKVRKVPLHALKKNKDGQKEELSGQKKDDKISSMICDLSELVASTKSGSIGNSLDHLLHCFECFILNVNEFLDPEELCNDLRSFLDKSIRYPELCERFVKLVSHVKDHDTFPSAVTFALPRVIDDHLKTCSPALDTEPLCKVLSLLYGGATSWPPQSRLAVHDLVLGAVEKWFQLCQKSDAEPARVSAYCACVDLVLPSIGAHVSQNYMRRMDGFVDSMREMVLSDHICRSDREIILDLLIMEGRLWREYQDFLEACHSDETTKNHRAKPGPQNDKKDSSSQTTSSPYRYPDHGHVAISDPPQGDVKLRHDVTPPVDDGFTDEDYIDVRLMLLELNLSQYLDEMKQCGITDEVLASPDIDLAGLMHGFKLPAVVAKRVLLHLGRDLPPWLFTKISNEKSHHGRPDWSLYRDPNKIAPSLEHVSQLGDFMDKQGPLFKTQTMGVKVGQYEVKVTSRVSSSDDELALDDSDSFPPLKGAGLVAPPKVSRVLDDSPELFSGNLKGDHLRMSDLAKEIMNSSYAGALKKEFSEQAESAQSYVDSWHDSSSRNADTDNNWRRKDSPGQKADTTEQASPDTPGTENEISGETEKKSESPDQKEPDSHNADDTEAKPDRIDLVALCHDTGALEFKFPDEEEPSEQVAGLNSVLDLFTEPAKSSPITRGTRLSPRPSSNCSQTSSPCRTPDWFDLEVVEKRSRSPSMELERDLSVASDSETPTCWTDLLSAEVSPSKCYSSNTLQADLREADLEFRDDCEEKSSQPDDDDIRAMITAIESQRETENERRERVDKILNPKQSKFKGFSMVCTNCGAKDHRDEHCPIEKKLIFY